MLGCNTFPFFFPIVSRPLVHLMFLGLINFEDNRMAGSAYIGMFYFLSSLLFRQEGMMEIANSASPGQTFTFTVF